MNFTRVTRQRWRDLAESAAKGGEVEVLIQAIEAAIGAGEKCPPGTAQRLINAWRSSGRSLTD